MEEQKNTTKSQPPVEWGKPLLWVGIVLLLIPLFFGLYQHGGNATFDDAYMFLRYAKNFADGYGVAWNRDGVPTYGVTAFLYFLVVTVAHASLPLQDSHLLFGLSTFLGVAALFVLAKTAACFSQSEYFSGRFLWGFFLVLLLVSFTPHFSFHCATGMDTTLALLMNSLLVYVTLQYHLRGGRLSFVSLVLVGYLCFLTRPDNLLYVVFFPTLFFLQKFDRASLRMVLSYLCFLGLLLIVDTLWKVLLFGDPLPLPFYAKQADFFKDYTGASFWSSVRFFKQFLFVALPTLIVIVAFAQRVHARLIFAFLFPVLLTFAYLLTVNQVMGFYARFFFPSLPFFFVLAVLLADRYCVSPGGVGRLRPLGPRVLALLFLAFLLSPYGTFLWRAWEHHRFGNKGEDTLVASQELQLERNTSWQDAVRSVAQLMEAGGPETVFAMSEHGVVGALKPEIEIVDMVGLHDPFFARHGFVAENLLARKVDFIWLPPHEYVSLRRELIEHQEFREEYEYYPAALSYGAAIRRRSPAYTRLAKAMATLPHSSEVEG